MLMLRNRPPLQVSAWLCTVMATTFFTASLATEKLQGSLYVSFVVTSIGEGHMWLLIKRVV